MGLFPDYEGGSILNLIAAIQSAHGKPSEYPSPRIPIPDMKDRTVVLVLIDALGDRFLEAHGKDSFCLNHRLDSMTSVFLSTTACAMTTYYSALPPLQHALTGWFVYLRELGLVTQVLPFRPRVPSVNLHDYGVEPGEVLDFDSVFSRLDCPAVGVFPWHIVGSPFSDYTTKGATSRAYRTLPEFTRNIRDAVLKAEEPTFIMAYWPAFDKTQHIYGVSHWRSLNHFRRIDRALAELYDSLRGSGALLIVSADHGMIDVPAENVHWLQDLPELSATLSMPLSGEPRVPYCNVWPGCESRFQQAVQDAFGERVQVYDRERLLREGWYGKGTMNPQLPDRIGDFALLFDDARVLRDVLPGERSYNFAAYHGGITEDEMLVPLIAVEC